MGHKRSTISILAIGAVMLGSTIAISAQYQSTRRGNNSNVYRGNDNYYLNSSISTLNSQSRGFQKVLDRTLDNSRLDGSRQEDQLNDLAKDFKKAADDLDDTYDHSGDFNRSRDKVNRVLAYGAKLDYALSSSPLQGHPTLTGDWRNIEKNLRQIGSAFRVNYTGGRYQRSRSNNGYYNGNYNQNNNRYPQYNVAHSRLNQTIKKLARQSKNLEKRLDRESRYNQRRNNRYQNSSSLKSLASQFTSAAKNLDRAYNNRRDFRSSTDEAQRLMRIASRLDRAIEYSRTGSQYRNDWRKIESNLGTLAQAYRLRYGSSNRTSGNFGILNRF